MVFGGENIIAIQGDKGVAFTDVTQSVLAELTKINDVSAISQIDFDKDGDLDLVLSRAEHQFEPETYFDQKNNRFAFFARFQPLQLEDLTIKGNFTIENIQMAFPHFDVFVGKQKRKLELDTQGNVPSFERDIDGSVNLSLSPDEADGFAGDVCVEGLKMQDLPKNSKPGLYIGHVGNGVWRVCSQTQSPTAGVIHNVISEHATSIDEPLPAILLENHNGIFIDATDTLGININEQTTSVVSGDFDNDGWDDLLFSPYGNMATENQQILYLNRQGEFFERVESHGIVSTDLGATGSGVETIDYDKDGDLDLITANERGRWHLYTNNAEKIYANNYIGVNIKQSPSGQATAFGAQATLTACSQKATKTVGNTSSPFAVTYNTDVLFGLGKCSKIDSIRVTWTNGESLDLTDLRLNQYLVAGN